jgi:hypothetical protein
MRAGGRGKVALGVRAHVRGTGGHGIEVAGCVVDGMNDGIGKLRVLWNRPAVAASQVATSAHVKIRLTTGLPPRTHSNES